jgi:hypothetical protein
MHMVGRLMLVALLIASTGGATAQETPPAPPFYQLLPLDYPYPLIRVCSTQWGVCAIPVTVVPGTPCSCLTASGVWVPGVCVR